MDTIFGLKTAGENRWQGEGRDAGGKQHREVRGWKTDRQPRQGRGREKGDGKKKGTGGEVKEGDKRHKTR